MALLWHPTHESCRHTQLELRLTSLCLGDLQEYLYQTNSQVIAGRYITRIQRCHGYIPSLHQHGVYPCGTVVGRNRSIISLKLCPCVSSALILASMFWLIAGLSCFVSKAPSAEIPVQCTIFVKTIFGHFIISNSQHPPHLDLTVYFFQLSLRICTMESGLVLPLEHKEFNSPPVTSPKINNE